MGTRLTVCDSAHSVQSRPDEQLQHLNSSLCASYTKQSSTYDVQRTRSVNGRFFFEVAYQVIDEMIGPTNERTVHLDMPVGTGRFLCYLRDRGRIHRMIGIDLSPGMLRTCRAKMIRRADVVALAQGDAFHLPIADDSVDVLTSMRFFHLFPHRYWPGVIAEMHRVIRPGGFVIAELRNILRGVGAACLVEYRDRWLCGGRRRSYAWPHQVRSLFDGWTHLTVRGAGLDGLGRLSTVAPRWANRLHGLTRHTPWRYVAKELVIKAHKPV
jgi:ubiquinone/menaquinone biosynthesis C-methylase UbiE